MVRKKIGSKLNKKSSFKANTGKIDQALINNLIALQKVMVNLSYKLENLTDQISKLLQLFEISAKTLAKKEFEVGREAVLSASDTKKIFEKLESLSKQAGLIGKGLALIHEVSSEKEGLITSSAAGVKSKDEYQYRGATPSIMSSKRKDFQEKISATAQAESQQKSRFFNVNADVSQKNRGENLGLQKKPDENV